uniref:Phosphohydrolase n=1 Tax=Anisakis simplex TaxID=6269 RepID=A0A0M3JFP8_ANISI
LAQIATNYVLPPGYPIQPTTHLVTRDLADAVLVYMTPADPNQIALIPDPFTRIGQANYDHIIHLCRIYEDVLLAGTILIRNRLVHAMLSSA